MFMSMRFACEAGNLAEDVGHRHGEAQIDERLRHLAVANPERPVAGHPGQDASARIDDAQVVEPGDVDAVADPLG